jgi:membrane protease YdiL (CAAX protease family)
MKDEKIQSRVTLTPDFHPSSLILHPSSLPLVFALLFPTLFTWVYFVLLAKSPGALQQTVYTACKTIQFVFPLAWVLAVERWRPTWRWPGAAGLAAGVVFGAVVLAAAVVLYHLWLKPGDYLAFARGEIREKLAQFGVHGPLGYVALAAFYSVIHSFLEEYYWRWFVFGRLRDLMPWKTAVVVASVGFMGHHVIVLGTYFGWSSPATWLFSLAVGAGGAFWAWLYHTSRSLLGPWLSHLLIDAAVFIVGYDLAGPLS